MSWNDMPGLGTATGTRVDSAAKHIMACKMDTRLLACWLGDDKTDVINALHADKMKWCMHKDEIVLNTSKNNTLDPAVKAYPLVVTTVGDMHDKVIEFLKSLYASRSASEFFTRQNLHESNAAPDVQKLKELAGSAAIADAEAWARISQKIASLPDFRCQGIALGQAWASYLSGDTVASVLVGGMVTVQNGHFTMHTGDMVQWYFDFEQDAYDKSNKNTNGARLMRGVNGAADGGTVRRQGYMDERLYGSAPTLGKGSYKKPNSVVRIKSYRMHMVNSQAHVVHGGAAAVAREYFAQDHYGDKIRVFAKCVSGGRAFDAVDIMLMTQSL